MRRINHFRRNNNPGPRVSYESSRPNQKSTQLIDGLHRKNTGKERRTERQTPRKGERAEAWKDNAKGGGKDRNG